jgi:hypothetical protein
VTAPDTAAEALARLSETVQTPGQALVRLGDLRTVLTLLGRVADERDVLRQMVNRDR